MQERQLLVGVDPGTTLGYAVLDFDGNVIETDASRLLGMNGLISHISEIGLPLIIATDRKQIPGFVNRVATRLGARAVSPGRNLLVNEKRALVKGFRVRSDHERDALAAALLSHRTIRPMLAKISSFLSVQRREDALQEVRRIMLLNEGVSIQNALSAVDAAKEKAEPKRAKPVHEQRLTAEARIRQLTRENRLIREQSERLAEELSRLGRQKLKVPSERPAVKLLRKDQKIAQLQGMLRQAKAEGLEMKRRYGALVDALSRIRDFQVVKCLENLGVREVERAGIREGDVIYVRNPGIVSEKALAELRGKAAAIVTNRPGRLLEGFCIVPEKGLMAFGRIGVLPVSEMRRGRVQRNLINMIVEDYRRERNG